MSLNGTEIQNDDAIQVDSSFSGEGGSVACLSESGAHSFHEPPTAPTPIPQRSQDLAYSHHGDTPHYFYPTSQYSQPYPEVYPMYPQDHPIQRGPPPPYYSGHYDYDRGHPSQLPPQHYHHEHPGYHGYGPPPGYHGMPHQHPHWHSGPPIEYIPESKRTPKDVLCGRGGATNSYPGNREYRRVVDGYKRRYKKAKKCDKPSIAKEVLREIQEKGGRFLNRTKDSDMWFEISDKKALDKICQTLRDGGSAKARESRDGMKDVPKTHAKKSHGVDLMPSASMDCTVKTADSSTDGSHDMISSSNGSIEEKSQHKLNEKKYIEPWPKYIVTPFKSEKIPPFKAGKIAIDSLGSETAKLYRTHFTPPDPTSDARPEKGRILIAVAENAMLNGESEGETETQVDENEDQQKFPEVPVVSTSSSSISVVGV